MVYKAKAEKYAKIISKTIILSGMDAASLGQNAYFYDAAEGLLTATILLVAEFCEAKKRHIVSVFKIIQELLAPSQKKGKNQFQQMMELLPDDHKAKWFAGAALNTAEQSMASVMSTALSRLNSFLDSELEQLLCFDTEIDAEKFCRGKCAVFLIMPEENPNTFFMISLIIQQLYREILSVADEMGGKLKNRCVFFCDEYGTLPKIESAEMMFSASRSRRLQIVPVIQSFAQLEKNPKPFFNFEGFLPGKSHDTDPNLFLRFLKNLGRNIKATGVYFLIGILLSALFQRYVPSEQFAELFGAHRGFGVLLAATVGVPLYVCGGGTIPLLQEWLVSGM